MALKLVISPYFFIHEAFSLLLSHLLPRGPSGSSVLKGSHTFFWMHMKVSRYPTGRCSEMIYVKLGDPKECTGEGMLEVTSVSFFYKNKTLSRDSLGAGAHLDVPELQSQNPK